MNAKKILQAVGLTNSFIQLSFFAAIFAFKSNLSGIGLLFEHSLAVILFPLAIAPDAIAAALSFLSYWLTTNRNFGALFDPLYTTTKASLVFTAVFANVSLLAVNSLFIGAIGLGILYHASLAIYNGYQWFKLAKMAPTPQTELRRNVYKQNVIDNLLAVLIGLVALTALFVTIIFVKLLSVPLVAAIGIGAAISLPILGALLIYQSLCSPKKTEFSNRFLASTLSLDSSDSQNQIHNHSDDEAAYLFPKQHRETTPPHINHYENEPTATDAKNYYYRAFRRAQLTGDPTIDKTFLEEEIVTKRAQLQAQITASKQTIKEKIWPQEKKRLAKIEFLNQLQHHLENDFSSTEAMNSRTKKIQCDQCGATRAVNDSSHILNTVPNGAFQSFFRQVSDTEDLADAVVKSFFRQVSDTEDLAADAVRQFGEGWRYSQGL